MTMDASEVGEFGTVGGDTCKQSPKLRGGQGCSLRSAWAERTCLRRKIKKKVRKEEERKAGSRR